MMNMSNETKYIYLWSYIMHLHSIGEYPPYSLLNKLDDIWFSLGFAQGLANRILTQIDLLNTKK